LAAFDAAVAGGVSPILVLGNAGIGKTRFVTEIRRRDSDRVVLVGGCLPLASPLPLLPVVQALRDLARRDDGDVLRTALKACPTYVRLEVSRLLPELGDDAEEADIGSSSPGGVGATAPVHGRR